ncbi:MULE domain-containing protein [Aphis craccivora]|uniref:MULE domain-containing protein n=1 Tax=Aphis craccivora TaxID=307492 RepID=A0A6G0YHG1_APHCR|nr:MULE domain-containing protein [Aphis craccivora]
MSPLFQKGYDHVTAIPTYASAKITLNRIKEKALFFCVIFNSRRRGLQESYRFGQSYRTSDAQHRWAITVEEGTARIRDKQQTALRLPNLGHSQGKNCKKTLGDGEGRKSCHSSNDSKVQDYLCRRLDGAVLYSASRHHSARDRSDLEPPDGRSADAKVMLGLSDLRRGRSSSPLCKGDKISPLKRGGHTG